jgi:hypothetical protein
MKVNSLYLALRRFGMFITFSRCTTTAAREAYWLAV